MFEAATAHELITLARCAESPGELAYALQYAQAQGDTIHVPEDEICFFVFDAPSGRDAALAAQRAELAPLRVVEAVSSGKDS